LAVKRGIKLERKATRTCRIKNYVITVLLIWDVLSRIRIFFNPRYPDTRIPDLEPGSLIPDLKPDLWSGIQKEGEKKIKNPSSLT
jgi:hypothetical protein